MDFLIIFQVYSVILKLTVVLSLLRGEIFMLSTDKNNYEGKELGEKKKI
jgi:hypothetical protein